MASTSGELLYLARGADAGLSLFAMTSAGSEREVSSFTFATPPDVSRLKRVGLDGIGRMLSTFTYVDGGCDVAFNAPDGSLELLLHGASQFVEGFADNCERVVRLWPGADGTVRGLKYPGRLTTPLSYVLVAITDGGVSNLAGHDSPAGRRDGFGAGASLQASTKTSTQMVAEQDRVFFTDREIVTTVTRSLRVYSDDAGVRTTASDVRGLASQFDGGVVFTDVDTLWRVSSSLSLTGLPFDGGVVEDVPISDPSGEWRTVPLSQHPNTVKTVSRWDSSLNLLSQLAYQLPQGAPVIDGPPATATVLSFTAPLANGPGSFLFLDGNQVRRFDDGTISTIAGQNDAGFADGPATAARFDGPSDIERGPNGELYITDSNNFALRVLTPAGQVSTIARFKDRPRGLAIAPNGDVYVVTPHALLRGR